jgi:hypothetical protein
LLLCEFMFSWRLCNNSLIIVIICYGTGLIWVKCIYLCDFMVYSFLHSNVNKLFLYNMLIKEATLAIFRRSQINVWK